MQGKRKGKGSDDDEEHKIDIFKLPTKISSAQTNNTFPIIFRLVFFNDEQIFDSIGASPFPSSPLFFHPPSRSHSLSGCALFGIFSSLLLLFQTNPIGKQLFHFATSKFSQRVKFKHPLLQFEDSKLFN